MSRIINGTKKMVYISKLNAFLDESECKIEKATIQDYVDAGYSLYDLGYDLVEKADEDGDISYFYSDTDGNLFYEDELREEEVDCGYEYQYVIRFYDGNNMVTDLIDSYKDVELKIKRAEKQANPEYTTLYDVTDVNSGEEYKCISSNESGHLTPYLEIVD